MVFALDAAKEVVSEHIVQTLVSSPSLLFSDSVHGASFVGVRTALKNLRGESSDSIFGIRAQAAPAEAEEADWRGTLYPDRGGEWLCWAS